MKLSSSHLSLLAIFTYNVQVGSSEYALAVRIRTLLLLVKFGITISGASTTHKHMGDGISEFSHQ